MDAMQQIESVARRVAKRFPRWTVEDVISELWIICEEAGVPAHACHLRLFDAYTRSFGTLGRKTAARWREAGRHVPQMVTGGVAVEIVVEDTRHRDDVERMIDEIEAKVGNELGYQYLCMMARGLSGPQIAIADGRTNATVYRHVNRVRAMVA